MITNLPADADLETCLDSCLREVCDVITRRRNLPDDIRSVLCGAAATLAVALASSQIKQKRALIKKCRVRTRVLS